MKILIIIVFFKNSNDLKSLLDDLRPFGWDICVVNNGEKKDIEFVKKEGNNITLIQNKENLGFARGVNVALRLTSFAQGYNLVWILNPDCRVEIKGKDRLDSRRSLPRTELRGGNDKVAGTNNYDIFSPVIYDTNGKIWFAGGKIDLLTGECAHCQQIIPDEANGLNPGSKNKSVFGWKTEWVSGCSMFVRPKVFKEIGLFDERFFLFYEDVDFCLRAGKAGFKVGMVNEEDGIGGLRGVGDLGKIRVAHKVSRSVNEFDLKEKYRIETRSKWHFLRKNWREFYLSAFIVSWLRFLKHRLLNC